MWKGKHVNDDNLKRFHIIDDVCALGSRQSYSLAELATTNLSQVK